MHRLSPSFEITGNKRAINCCTKEEFEWYDLLAPYQQWKHGKESAGLVRPLLSQTIRSVSVGGAETESGAYIGGYGI
jgi:hypothetical protein